MGRQFFTRLVRSRAAAWGSVVLVAGCVVAWVLSYANVAMVRVSWGYGVEAGWSWGMVYLTLYGDGRSPAGVMAGVRPIDPFGPVIGANWRRAGFDWSFDSGRRGISWLVGMPFWFVTLMLVMVSWLLWWTRRKSLLRGNGFPVERATHDG